MRVISFNSSEGIKDKKKRGRKRREEDSGGSGSDEPPKAKKGRKTKVNCFHYCNALWSYGKFLRIPAREINIFKNYLYLHHLETLQIAIRSNFGVTQLFSFFQLERKYIGLY